MTEGIPARAPTVQVILGSVRAGRICPGLAAWIVEIGHASTGLNYELVDLADWPLPMDDEPGIPALGEYAQPHTLAWSRKIAAAAAFVFVTPQYNRGYPAVLKNAIDHLFAEWAEKPVAIITYGGHAGDKCAAQLRQVTEGVNMRPVATMPGIKLTHDMIKSGNVEPEQDFQTHIEAIRQSLTELAEMLKVRPN